MLMKNCPNCGSPQEGDALFCDACGSQFPKPQPNFSKLSLAGFICSLVSLAGIVLVVSCIRFLNDSGTVLPYVVVIAFFVSAVASLAGLIISIVGLVRSLKKKQKGVAFGIIGIILSSILMLVIAIISFSLAAVILLIVGLASAWSHSSHDYTPYTEPTLYTEPTEYTYDYDNMLYDDETTTEKRTMTYGFGPEKINLWSFTDEVPKMVGQYIKQNPEFADKYTVECTIIATDGGAYQTALDNAIVAGGETAPDIYTAEAAFILKYSQGDMARFAAPYKDLGIDVENKIKEADIAQYSVEVGTRDGEVVALGYQATGSAMIYNANVALDVFGTDDPEEIEKIVGAGSGDWNKFFEAAEKLKAKGYAAISGPQDIWNPCEKSADTAWIVDAQLNIDPKRERYLDLAKTIKDKGYSNDAQSWSEAWYQDMKGEGEQKVFAFFGPAWLINYVMIGNSGGNKIGEGTYGQWRVCAPPVGFFWGGTWLLANKDTDHKEGVAELIEWITLDPSDTGLQYLWANGIVDWDNDPQTKTAKDTVASATVMAKSDGTLEFCGGQNIFPAFISGNKYASAKAMTQYDETINGYFTDAAAQYAEGNVGRDEAIENFKTNVYDNLSF